MLLAFIILLVVANSGMIYADSNGNSTENLFTQSADDLPEDSVNTTENSTDNIINTPDSDGNINNIDPTENQNNFESSSSDSIDSNSEIGTINNSDSNKSSQSNNPSENNSEKANKVVNTTIPVSSATVMSMSTNQGSSGENIITTLSASSSSTKFSKNDIISAATQLKKYVEKYGKLPDYLTLCGEKLSMSDFLYLLSKSILNMNSGSSADVTAKDVKDPSGPSGSATNGLLYKSGYVDLAKRVVAFIDNNNQAPNYGSSSLGNIRFQTMTYGFAKIVDYFGTHKVMPNYVSFEKAISTKLNNVIPKYSGSNGLIVSGSSSGNDDTGKDEGSGSDSTPSSGTISLANIKDAGARVESFVNTNGVLPNYVVIAGKQYSMTDFLYLASSAIVNINKGSSSGIAAKTFKDATKPAGSSIKGDIDKKNFVDLASRVSSYMLKNGQAPNYGSSTLGNMQFQTMVLAFSKILEFAKSEGRLPNYLTLNIKSTDKLNGGSGSSSDDSGSSGSGSIPNGPLNEKNTLSQSELKKYLQSTYGCDVNNAAIKSLAASLTKNCKTELEKATAIFEYVRKNIDYSSYYDTVYKATGTLSRGAGNCVDQSHLLAALFRSSGLATRYVHADCYFTTSKKWIGHVFVQVLVGDKWVVADTTSSYNRLGTITNWNTNTYKLKGQGKSAAINF